MHTIASSYSARTHRRASHACAAPARTRWASVAMAMLMAACVHSPQAAVSAGALGVEGVAPLTSPQGEKSGAVCRETAATRTSLGLITRELQSQGMSLQASCNAQSGAWVMQVRVVDGMKASKIVRGPLADGHDVDMGTPAGVVLAGAPAGAAGFSPDVQHNRQWLQSLMARHQFDNLPDAWWHFAQRGTASPLRGGESDMAAR